MKPGLEADLRAFLEAEAARPLVWGISDCCMMPARWAGQRLGRRLGLPRYASEAEARALAAAAGGLPALWRQALARSGLREVLDPAPGDVALVDTLRFGPVGVIACAGGIMAWRGDIGITFLRPRPEFVVAAWSVP